MTVTGGVLTLTMLVGGVGAFLAFTRAGIRDHLDYYRCKHDWEVIGGRDQRYNDDGGCDRVFFFCRKCKRRKQDSFIWW